MLFPGDIEGLIKKKPALNSAIFLVLINILIYGYTRINFKDNFSAQTLQFIKSHNQEIVMSYKQTLDPLVQVKYQNITAFEVIRDTYFWNRIQNYPLQGDEVALKEMRDFFYELKIKYAESPQYIYGLSTESKSMWAWLTYQFMHTGLMHLFTNMLFLLLVTTLLSQKFSDVSIYSVYLLSGLGGGLFYILLADNNHMSVVGASGAISGLMVFLIVVENRKNIIFTYFIAPIKNGYGKIWLPCFALFPLYIVSDFTQMISQSQQISQVAYSAHIGGALVGFLMGVYFHFDQAVKIWVLRKFQRHLNLNDFDELRNKIK